MDPSRTPSPMLRGLERAWSTLGYLVGGIVVWGGIGYWLDGVLGWRPVLTIVGALVGNAAGIYLIYVHMPYSDAPVREVGRRAA